MDWLGSIPAGLSAPSFIIEPLQESHAALDYEAYISSPDVIRIHSAGRWPTKDFTLQEDRLLLAGHYERH